MRSIRTFYGSSMSQSCPNIIDWLKWKSRKSAENFCFGSRSTCSESRAQKAVCLVIYGESFLWLYRSTLDESSRESQINSACLFRSRSFTSSSFLTQKLVSQQKTRTQSNEMDAKLMEGKSARKTFVIFREVFRGECSFIFRSRQRKVNKRGDRKWKTLMQSTRQRINSQKLIESFCVIIKLWLWIHERTREKFLWLWRKCERHECSRDSLKMFKDGWEVVSITCENFPKTMKIFKSFKTFITKFCLFRHSRTNYSCLLNFMSERD